MSSGGLSGIQAGFEAIYRDVNPSVVNVRVVQSQVVNPATQLPLPFFGFPAPDTPREQFSVAEGSGFVWDDKGHVVTNNHVIADADKITVTLSDGTTTNGSVIGADPDSDLAVIELDSPPTGLKPLEIAGSGDVKVGQVAIAIGNPFGLQGTMTTGIISAVGRSLPVDEGQSGGNYTIPDAIQTDAPINPGNSGGVLLDADGKLVGVTSAIISPVRASAGIGFAIPSWIVNRIVPALISEGRFDHSWLGAALTSLNPDLAGAMGLDPGQRGAMVIEVFPGSPADGSGLRGSDRQVTIDGQDLRVGGDIIIDVDGNPIRSADDLILYLTREVGVGDTVSFTFLRDGATNNAQVTLAARPASEAASAATDASRRGNAWLGVTGLTVTPPIAAEIGLPNDQRGVLIQQILAGSPADAAGLHGSFRPTQIDGNTVLTGGDVVTAWNGQPVDSIDDLRTRVAEAAPNDAVNLTLVRDGSETNVSVILGQRDTG